jgi:hypothetical protein
MSMKKVEKNLLKPEVERRNDSSSGVALYWL